MKFTGFKTSFKGGMVSRRLVGRQKEGELVSSVEKMENFNVDRVGGAVKRGGLTLPRLQPFINANDDVITYDSTIKADTVATVSFAVNLKGREFVLTFDTTKAINAITKTADPTAEADFQSTFLQVTEHAYPTSGPSYKANVRTFAPYYTGTLGAGNMEAMTNFDFAQGGSPVDTYIRANLNDQIPTPIQMTKVTDATVVFSCDASVSFSVTLTNIPATTYTSAAKEYFIILPYFVNVRAFFANIGVSAAAAANYYCPIRPTNFPWNVINTNPNFTVAFAVVAGQTGPSTADSILANAGDKFLCTLDFPSDVCVNKIGQPANQGSLEGRFVSIPLATDNTKDVIFFITKYYSTPSAGVFRFVAIRVIGGTPLNNSSLWKLSTFGGGDGYQTYSHPKVVDYSFGRLVYGNAGAQTSKWWASGVHPSSLTDFQGFMGFSLGQDLTSDVSHMNYEGITQPKLNDAAYVPATDVNRYGFSSSSANLSTINFITSRRKIHIGTIEGETQAELSQNSFAKLDFAQISVRTNSAEYYSIAKGDGKFFYISNGGKDIRSISTEDKYYESQDELMTTALEGLGIIFKKLVWYEKANAIVALTTTGRVFFITSHEDTQIKAISEFTSQFTILDICGTNANLYFVVAYNGYQFLSRYLVRQRTALTAYVDSDNAGDFAVTYPATTDDPISYVNIFAFFKGQTIYALFKGVLYSIPISNAYNGVQAGVVLPFDISTASYTYPVFFFGKKVTAKIKTLPIDEGGQGGTAVGDSHRIDQLELLVDNTGPFKAGTEGGTLYDVEGLTLSPLSTKYVKFDFPQTSDDENHLYLETDNPTPVNIAGVAYRGKSDPGV